MDNKPKKGCLGKVLPVIIIIVALIVVVAAFGGNSEDSEPTKVGTVNSAPPSKTEPPEDSSSSSTSGTGSGSPEATEPPAPESTPEPAPAQTVFHVGDILKDGDTEIVYVASGIHQEDNQFMQPEDGMQYIFLEFAFLNRSEKNDSSISFYSFDCYADGYACDAYYGGDNGLSATLSPGRSTTGFVYFTVPVDAQDIEVEYETNFLTQEKITFVYDGDQDSGYELEKNTTATEGALQVGDSKETSGLTVNYLNCFADESDNMFITPKDGFHYVTLEIEFENTSDSDKSVSAFSFVCFADGASCDGAYFRDDNLSASMSAGRKAKGTVTFEVPDGAQVVEVEYESNVWTNEKVVFNALPAA